MTASEPWVHALDAASAPAAERARAAASWAAESARQDRILLQTCHRVELYGVGPLEGGTESDASMRRVVDALVDSVAGIRQADREWLQLELFRSGAGR